MTTPLNIAVVTEGPLGASAIAAAAAPQSVALLDWERIHEQLVAALREAIARPAMPAPADPTFRFVPD